MSRYEIEVDDEKIKEKVNEILNQIFNEEMTRAACSERGLFAVAAKEIVYSHKEEIIEKVVNRATKEIVKKGLPKLLEKF